MTHKITVLMIADKLSVSGSSIHGVGRLFSWWLPRFDTSRFDVRLVSLRGKDAGVIHLREKGIDVTVMDRSKFDPRTVSDLVKLCRERQVDIVHLHGYGAANFGRIAARIAGVKTIVHEHLVDPYMPGYQVGVDFLQSWMNDKGIAVGEDVLEFMIAKRGVRREIMEVIHNGAPISDFQRPPKQVAEKVRSELGIPLDAPLIGSVSRLDEQKGIAYFLDAAEEVLKERPDARFLIVGDGPLMNDLKAQAERQGTAHAVTFAGYRADVGAVQSAFDVYVISSLWEGGPLTVFEALAMACPMVATRVGRLKEVLVHEQNAMLAEEKDGHSLAVGMLRLINDPEFAKKLGDAAADGCAKYDIQLAVDRMQEVYVEMLASD